MNKTKILMLLTGCEKDVKIASKMLVTHPMKSTTVKSATLAVVVKLKHFQEN